MISQVESVFPSLKSELNYDLPKGMLANREFRTFNFWNIVCLIVKKPGYRAECWVT